MSIARVNSIVDATGGNNVSVAGKTFITSTDTIASNNNDTTIPTSAAVKAYADGAVSAITTMYLLGTLTTTSGTTQTLSGLTLTPYKSLLVVMDGVSLNADAAIKLGGVAITGVTTAADGCYGHASVDLASGVVSAVIMNGGPTDRANGKAASPMAGRTSYSTATTSISFAGGTFDGGSIRVYGVK